MTAWQVRDLFGGWDALLQNSPCESLSEALRRCVVVLFAHLVVFNDRCVFWICALEPGYTDPRTYDVWVLMERPVVSRACWIWLRDTFQKGFERESLTQRILFVGERGNVSYRQVSLCWWCISVSGRPPTWMDLRLGAHTGLRGQVPSQWWPGLARAAGVPAAPLRSLMLLWGLLALQARGGPLQFLWPQPADPFPRGCWRGGVVGFFSSTSPKPFSNHLWGLSV